MLESQVLEPKGLTDPSLVLDLPLYDLDGSSFKSRDRFGHLCTRVGNSAWGLQGDSMDGAGDRVTVANHSSFAFTDEKFTLELVLRTFDFDAHYTPVSKGTGNAYWVAIRTDGAIYFATSNGVTSPESKTASSVWTLNNEHHLVIVKNGASVKIYLDSIDLVLATAAVHTDIQANTGVLSIGDLFNGSGQDYQGNIRIVRIYNRILNPLEIKRNCLATKGR